MAVRKKGLIAVIAPKQERSSSVSKKTIKDALYFLDVATSYKMQLRMEEDRREAKRISELLSQNKTVEAQERKQYAALTKFEYAINKIITRVNRELSKDGGYREKQQDLNAEYGSVDEKVEGPNKPILYDARGNVQFTNANQLLVNKKAREYQREEIKFEMYEAQGIPVDLDELIVDAFRGFVLPDDYELKPPPE